jgi:hypothetical protein
VRRVRSPHVQEDEQFLWIAEQALLAPLPPQWCEVLTENGATAFKNTLTGVVTWTHPLEDQFRYEANNPRVYAACMSGQAVLSPEYVMSCAAHIPHVTVCAGPCSSTTSR